MEGWSGKENRKSYIRKYKLTDVTDLKVKASSYRYKGCLETSYGRSTKKTKKTYIDILDHTIGVTDGRRRSNYSYREFL